MSEANDPLDSWPVFAEGVRRRLENGRTAYGDQSFSRPLPELADEIAQELLDTAGWAFVAFVRLQALSSKLEEIEKRDVHHPVELDSATPAASKSAPPIESHHD
jgi:hypothetical protein